MGHEGRAGDMSEASALYVICSDRPREGKTLLAQLLVDWLRLKGARPQVIDLDTPAHPLAERYPGMSTKVDFGHTMGRVELFDGIVRQPHVSRVVELPVLYMDAFLQEAGTLAFFETVVAAGVDVVFLHFLTDAPAFLHRARQMVESLPREAECYLVHRSGSGAHDDADMAALQEEVGYDGLLAVPHLSSDILSFIEDPEFSFDAWMKGEIAVSDLVLRFRLNHLTNTMFEQFDRISLEIATRTCRKPGLL